MATWKCDVKMKFGKFSAHVWKATERPGKAVSEDLSTAKSAVSQCIDSLKAAGFAEGDEVIFRDSSYNSLAEAQFVMDRAPY